MARSLRVQFPGAFYQVAAEGRHFNVFADADERDFFLLSLGQVCETMGWRVHAWVLLRDRYKLFIQTPKPNLVDGMFWLQNVLTRRYNSAHGTRGRLFTDRYKSVIVEGGDPYCFQTMMDYIHLSPVRAKLIRARARESLADYPWSSLATAYALTPAKRKPWMETAAGFNAFQLKDTPAGRRSMIERLDARAKTESAAHCGIPPLAESADRRESHLGRGWYWGSLSFAAEMQALATSQAGDSNQKPSAHPRQPPRKLGRQNEAVATQWLTEGLNASDLTSADLADLKGSDPRKVLLADLLYRRTVVSQQWIANKLHMHSQLNVSQQLRRLDREKAAQKVPEKLLQFLKAADVSTP